jgi:hypothetical protein
MRIPKKRTIWVLACTIAAMGAIPLVTWFSLTHEPEFYQSMLRLSPSQRQAGAKRFVAQSLQLSNDIHNEPTWEAVFTDQEVNAWLAEDLVTHFADQIPPGVHEPRVMFEMNRVTLAFELDQGPLRTVISVVVRPYVPAGNVLELTVEKIRAGMLPVPSESVLDQITQFVSARGLDLSWKHDGDEPVAVVRYTPHKAREDVQLRRVDVIKGEIRLAGRSDRRHGVVFAPTLPTRKVLQANFPRWNVQEDKAAPLEGDPESETDAGPVAPSPESVTPATVLRSSASPTS